MSVAALQRVQAPTAAVEGRPRRGWHHTYARALRLSDAVAVVSGLLLAVYLRFGVSSASLHGVPYVVVAVAVGIAWIAVLAAGGCYERRVLGVGALEFKRIATASFRLVAVLAIVSYLLKLEVARGLVAIAFPTGTALLLASRYAARRWVHGQRRRGGLTYGVLLVGDAAHCRRLSKELQRSPCAGYRVVGACVPAPNGRAQLLDGVPILGGLAATTDVARAHQVDAIAVTASSGVTAEAVRRLGWELEGSGIAMLLAPTLTDVAGPRIHITPVAGLPLLHVDEPEFTGMRRLYKECVDRLIAALVLVVLAPIGASIALAVRLGSPGRALFRQKRVGQDGETFELLKFRSMYADAEGRLPALRSRNEADGTLFKIRNDPRVTRVGRWLRKWSLDELPQLWNVVRGDMALVGPRPPLPSEVAQYDSPAQRRLLVKPGITGLWQVSGRSDLSWEDTVRLDLYYVENWSPALDLLILWKTFFAVVRGTGAY